MSARDYPEALVKEREARARRQALIEVRMAIGGIVPPNDEEADEAYLEGYGEALERAVRMIRMLEKGAGE